MSTSYAILMIYSLSIHHPTKHVVNTWRISSILAEVDISTIPTILQLVNTVLIHLVLSSLNKTLDGQLKTSGETLVSWLHSSFSISACWSLSVTLSVKLDVRRLTLHCILIDIYIPYSCHLKYIKLPLYFYHPMNPAMPRLMIHIRWLAIHIYMSVTELPRLFTMIQISYASST